MPIETNLNVPPYFDDFDETKNYYKILFQPGVSVQVRELNQLQTLFQKQIERFGDNIFKHGTIISGCNFSFYNNYRYIKILDNDVDGVPVVPSIYESKFIKNELTGLNAYIVSSLDGFESTAPDLKTLYITYNNSGTSQNTSQFSPNDILTVYNNDNSIYSVVINDGGINFSNNDVVTFLPKIEVAMTSGSNFIAGDILQTELGANVEVVSVDTTTLANNLLITYKPMTEDLVSTSVESKKWTLSLNDTVKNEANTKIGLVSAVFGKTAEGRIITDGFGIIKEILIINGGEGYIYVPYTTVISKENSVGVEAASLIAKNYITKIKVDGAASSVGAGYAFGVSEGVTYQKGYFLRVSPQIVIVDKYSKTPNNVVCGFKTQETVIDYNEDNSLFDNVNNENKNAPGANRLFLQPVLTVLDSETAKANLEFFDLVEWNDGLPFKQNKQTQYSRLGEEMAQRTYDESGNYVLDTFSVATISTDDPTKDALYYTIVVDPGQAYINGFKAQTLRNYKIDVAKGLDTQTGKNYISLNYGNYVRVQNIGGLFNYSIGDSVDFYNVRAFFLTVGGGSITPAGTKIGTARIRSMIYENGIPGTPGCSYRIFLFDIKMNPGQNFSAVRSLYYNSTYKGIADVILQVDPTTGTNICKLEGTNNNKLLFSAGVESLKNSSNTTYIYRTLNQSATFSDNATGKLTQSVAASPNEYFPYTGELTSSQMKELYVVPLANNVYQFGRLTGKVSINTTSSNVTGTGTNFFSDFEAGDYICVEGSISNSIHKIVSISNATSMVLLSNGAFANSDAYFKRVFPKNIPIPFGSRTGLSANVKVSGQELTLYLNHSNGTAIGVEGASSIQTALGYNVERRDVSQSSKTAIRNRFIKIRCANSTYTTQGPWCIGVPDVFRLRNVYLSQSSTVNTSSKNVLSQFYIDHNQTANYLDLSWLYIKQKSSLTLTSSDWLLVEFDYFTGAGSGGYCDTVSYLNTSNSQQIGILDSTPLANLSTSAASLEVPEIYTYDGGYFDLLNQFDFRPAVSNTAAPVALAGISSAPVNPSSVKSFSSSDKKFPYPDTTMTTTIEQYLGRIDSVFMSGDEGGRIYVLKGISHIDPRKRLEANHPKDSLKLQIITVPPYPNVTQNLSYIIEEISKTNMANEKNLNLRFKTKVIMPIYSNKEMQLSQPINYTMQDIGNLDRRLTDLEYYVGLSILETSITNKSIPSSVDKTLNRFKFGFFADDFSTYNYSDLDNPEFAASIEVEGTESWGITKNPLETENWTKSDKSSPLTTNLSPSKLTRKATNRCVPPKHILTLNYITENMDYVDYAIVNQLNATVEKVDPPECKPPPPRYVSNTSYGFYWQDPDFRNGRYKTPWNFDFEVSPNTTGTMTYFGDHRFATNKVRIYQGNTLVGASEGPLYNWSAEDINLLKTLSPQFYNWNPIDQQYGKAVGRPFKRHPSGGFLFSAKITWTHNPNNGKKYRVVIPDRSGWKFLVLWTNVNTIVQDPMPPCKYRPPVYNGTLRIDKNTGRQWSCTKTFVVNKVASTFLIAEATGMKPNTDFNFYIDGVLCNDHVVPAKAYYDGSKAIWNITLSNPAPLRSDGSGKIQFRIFFPTRIPGATTTAQKFVARNWLQQIFKEYIQNTSYGSSGYTVFSLLNEAGDSSASLKVAQRKPEVSFAATNPLGNP